MAAGPQIPTSNRIEAFSDGVIAIVITLLVLELRVPRVEDPASAQALMQAVSAMTPKVLSFIFSFVMVAVFWVSHHHLYHQIRRSTWVLLWLNNLFLLFLAFTPFPTAMLGEYPDNTFAVMFFGSVMACAGLSFTLMRWYASVRAGLMPEVPRTAIDVALRRSIVGPLAYGCGVLAALFSIPLALALYVFVPVFYFLPGVLRKTDTAQTG